MSGAVDFATHPLHTYASGVNLHGNTDAAGALLLKPLAAAQRDNDTVLAIIDTASQPVTRTIGTDDDSVIQHIGCCGYAHGLLELLYGVMLAGQGESVRVVVHERGARFSSCNCATRPHNAGQQHN